MAWTDRPVEPAVSRALLSQIAPAPAMLLDVLPGRPRALAFAYGAPARSSHLLARPARCCWLLTTRTRPYLFAESVRGPLRKARARGARLLARQQGQTSLCARPPLVAACQPASSIKLGARASRYMPSRSSRSPKRTQRSRINGQERLRPHAGRQSPGACCLPCHGEGGRYEMNHKEPTGAFAASCLGALSKLPWGFRRALHCRLTLPSLVLAAPKASTARQVSV
jgi:hypothetical protein